MSSIEIIIFGLAAYALGSFPTAVLVGKAFYGVDVREHGSNNAGATNTFRVLGKKPGIAVLIIDIIKGATAANLALFVNGVDEHLISLKVFFGVLAVTGHIYPIFAGFKGGKGIATLLGLVIAIDPMISLGCVGVFLVVLIVSNMVSAGSILATFAFNLFSYFQYGTDERVLQFFGIFALILVLYTHRANIGRIMRGEEKKIYLFKNTKGNT